jgi:hypothetical protein
MTVQVFTPYQGRIIGLFAKVGDDVTQTPGAFWSVLKSTYHGRWMSRLGIPPVPALTVLWFFSLRDRLLARGRR